MTFKQAHSLTVFASNEEHYMFENKIKHKYIFGIFLKQRQGKERKVNPFSSPYRSFPLFISYRFALLKNFKPRLKKDGLNNLLYKRSVVTLTALYTNISVDIQKVKVDVPLIKPAPKAKPAPKQAPKQKPAPKPAPKQPPQNPKEQQQRAIANIAKKQKAKTGQVVKTVKPPLPAKVANSSVDKPEDSPAAEQKASKEKAALQGGAPDGIAKSKEIKPPTKLNARDVQALQEKRTVQLKSNSTEAKDTPLKPNR